MSATLTDAVRSAIAADPRGAFETVLLNPLTQKTGCKEPVALCPFHADREPSFRVNLDKAIWYCDVCARGGDALGLAGEIWGTNFPATVAQLADLLNVNHHNGNGARNGNGAHAHKPNRKVLRRLSYEIRDLEGTLKATHHRIEYDDGSKTMPWEPQGIQPREVPLFQIEKTTDSMDGDTVIVTEGEKPAAELWARRVLAVGTVVGADKRGAKVHCDDSLKALVRFDVVLWPDNDDPGHKHMRAHGDALVRLGCRSVRWIDWRDAPPKGDAADFQGDDTALLSLIESARPLNGPATEADADVVGDLAVADRIRTRHGDEMIYSPATGFYIWDGKCWELDQRETAHKLAEEVVRSIYGEAEAEKDADKKASLLQIAKSHSRAERIRGALAVARPHVAVAVDDLDRDPYAFNVRNGTVDLRSETLRPHRRDDRITKIVDIDYDPDAKAPRWEQFLLEIFDHNEALCQYVQRATGYSLTADQREQVFFFLWGGGANGKSTLISTILSIAGEYGQVAPASLFLAQRGTTANNPDEARLRGMRFVATSETGESRRLDEEKVKKLTGSERITACYKYRDHFEFDPSHHLWLSSNYKPRISGTDHAIWRRVKLILFGMRFEEPTPDNPRPEHPIDPELKNALLGELPGVLTWTIRGARDWYEHGLDEPEVITRATAEYRSAEDILKAFIDECCIACSGVEATASSLYSAYRRWTEGEKHFWSKKEFGRRLGDRGFERKHGRTGAVYLGLAPADLGPVDDERAGGSAA